MKINSTRAHKYVKPVNPREYILTPKEWRIVRIYVQDKAEKKPGKTNKTRELRVLILMEGLHGRELVNLDIKDLPCFHGEPCIIVRPAFNNMNWNRQTRKVYIDESLENKINKYVQKNRPNAGPDDPLFVSCHGNRTLYVTVCMMLVGQKKRLKDGTVRRNGLQQILGIKSLCPGVFRRTKEYQIAGPTPPNKNTVKKLKSKFIAVSFNDFLNGCTNEKFSKKRLRSIRRSVYNANDRKQITLPREMGKQTSGSAKKFHPLKLVLSWREIRYELPFLPPLDSQRVKIFLKKHQAS